MVDDSFEGFHLTALDARRFDFGREFRGYDRARVDQFREQVAGELERLTRAYQELEQQTRYETGGEQSEAARRKALADLCHMLLASNEFVYVD